MTNLKTAVEALEPCPFCGGSDLNDDGWIDCRTCGATGPDLPQESKGREMWNRRSALRQSEGQPQTVSRGYTEDQMRDAYQAGLTNGDRKHGWDFEGFLDSLPDAPQPASPVQGVVDEKMLIGEFDATVWASEFKKLFPSIDEGLMLGWFANAIMSGYDHAKRQPASPIPTVSELEDAFIRAQEYRDVVCSGHTWERDHAIFVHQWLTARLKGATE